jgi:hypothetical protein
MKSCLKWLIVTLILLAVPALSEEKEEILVGILPVTVAGDYKPLNSEDATTLLYQGLLANEPKAKVILLERQDSIQTLPQALAYAKSKQLDMIIWGRVWFKKDAYTNYTPSPYYRGRVKLQVATEAALNVAWVPTDKLVLSQPTIVVSNKKTRSWITDDFRHLNDEQSMAANSIREVANSLIHVVRKRHQAGWFHQS